MLAVTGEGALLGDGLAGDAQRGDDDEPVGVMAAVGGDVGLSGADRVMAKQVSPDRLLDELGGPGAQHGAGSALVGLELVERELDLPALLGGRGGLNRADLGRVEQGGEQPVGGGRA